MPATTASRNDADADDDNETDEWLELQELEAELAHSGGGSAVAAAAGRGRSSGGQYVSIASTDDVGDNDEEKLLSSRNESSHATQKERFRRQSQDSDDEDDDGSKSALNMVKTVVAETDDPSLPNITFRVLLLGTILCAIGAAISQLFFVGADPHSCLNYRADNALHRCPVQIKVSRAFNATLTSSDALRSSPSFSSFLIILISYPAGHWLAQIMPKRYFTLFGHSFTLNPGPFGVKEHILITVLASSGSSAAYGADIITIQDLYYGQNIGPVGGILLILSTQMLGFGLSGLVYNLLVRPSKMVWPAILVPISLFNTLHGDSSNLTWQRLHFFRLAFLVVFVWQFVPSGVCDHSTAYCADFLSFVQSSHLC